ncbi:hypothetical protein J4E86_009519 [Alternaria arbusti]|uniref:uncharacterized protein n=1 Tax=Alternaria arbusti TaxID=232088 RepID=UPI00221FCAA9|nr:uncharacterized protein J4E86_009519 [Alternaria arbusti]KAI4944460.1 hypothetical protein J4E86_009519 [Alternaria arbusti]
MAEEAQTVNLKILSPSSDFEGGVNLADVPASTTVKELRSRIQDAAPSKPAPERMRLIYRGRVVANDADTLSNVFGVDNLRENKDQSLHLVLRELPTTGNPPASPTPRSATVPNPFRPAQAPAVPANPLQTNPFRALPQARPHHHHIPGQANAVPIPLPLPPQLQQQFTQAMAQQGQQNNEPTPDSTSQQPGPDAPRPADAAQGLPNLPGNGDQPLRREGVGPNGARWTVTYNQVNIPAQIRQPVPAFGLAPPLAFGRPPVPPGVIPSMGHDSTQRLLPRIQTIFQEAQREMENVRTLLQPARPSETQTDRLSLSNTSPLNLPVWRIDHIRQHLNTINQNLNVVERALALLPTEPEVVALRRSVTEIRVDALELNIILDRQQGGSPSRSSMSTAINTPILGPSSSTIPGAPIMTPAVPTTSQPRTQNTTQAMPADAPTELFLLSSPQGPVGVLFDQQGTYTTAPMVSTLPFQSFTNQFAQNRQLLNGLGQQIARGNPPPNLELPRQLANMSQTQRRDWIQNQNQTQNQNQNQNQNQDENQNQNQNQNANVNVNQPEENDRMVNVAGHMWLIFKLAAFVYFFSGGGGLYRPIMLGIVAGVVYLAQAGMFQEQFNVVRRHFEALLPVGALAERVAQPNNQRQTQHRGNLSPEEAARRILQQRRDQRFGWFRDSMRTVERAFALFVASLFPGVGERMVHAQEERERLERVAAREERERQEEEARRREEEAQAQREQRDEKKTEADLEPQDESNASVGTKGKERATTEEEATAPGPSS